MKIEEIRKVPWFQKNYFPVKLREFEQVNLDDVRAVFDDIEVCCFSCSVQFIQTKFIFATVCLTLAYPIAANTL